MISTILAATAAAVLAGAPVYQVPSGPPSAPAAPKAATVACEAYVYKGTTTDLCGAYPTAKDLDCKLLAKPVQLVTKGVDPWGLDRDGDGIGCDIKPSGSASASSSASAAPSRSARPSTSSSSSTTAEAHPDATDSNSNSGSQLPLTGPAGWWLFAGGSVLVMGGIAVFAAVRRRRVTFKP